MNAWLTRMREFLTRDLWEIRLDTLSWRRALGYRAMRLAYRVFEALLWNDELNVRAAALTYFTVLSIVPLMAFAFALLKGLGAYDTLVEEQLRPYVLRVLSENAALRDAFERILDFVGETGVASLGFIGLLAVLYAATRLLRNIEDALNHLWGVAQARSVLRQGTDYLAITLVTPLCLLLAAALATVSQLQAVVRFFDEQLGMGAVLEWAIGTLGPLFVVFLGLLFLYSAMPNTRVRANSALLGAAVGSVLWYLVLIAHVNFQMGVARFNALYSSFAALPIFLVWVDVQWLVVLTGAQLAASHQRERAHAQRRRADQADPAYREAVGLSLVLSVARAFVDGTRPHPTEQRLSSELDAPEPLVAELVSRLIGSGVVVAADGSEQPQLYLARSPEQLHVKDVLDALRRPPQWQGDAPPQELGLDAAAADVLTQLEHEQRQSQHNRTLRELVDAASDAR